MNERITEDIVREHFKKNIIPGMKIEEQKSSNARINKLLQGASKKGNGAGKPEFIITFEGKDFIIVVECKADKLKHESASGDKYSEYAVDGAKLYSSYLSKEFDVLSIAISGEENVKVSHFLQLRGKEAKVAFGDELLSVGSYLKYNLQTPIPKLDPKELPKYAKTLNDELHAMKVKESQRCLLISGILISFKDKSFKNRYKEIPSTKLALKLFETIKTEFEESLKEGGNGNNQKNKIEIINSSYAFIINHPALSKDPDNPKIKSLRNLMEDIENDICPLIKDAKHDVISQFYVEFLQYSNSDKGLGIVLTPSHITDLFSKLSNINKNSVLLDNCSGTGGFLISGMKHMIEDANGNDEKIKTIKKKQIVGIEYDADIYALACSNMFIHGDGKSGIEHGSCFEENIVENIKTYHPDIGHLNPPYKSEKTDQSEFKFILNNLSMLEKGGTCVAIIPMSCVLAQSGEELELKKEILNKHTLRAVFSMPSELFINSNVGVVTCIVVIEAHKPHPEGQEVYFGYYKDDGLIKRKPTGRQDYLNKWEGIKKQWVDNYRSGKEVPGFSVKKYVTAEDEWCAEAYMETDLSTLNEKDFLNSIKNFVIYQEMHSNE